MTKKDQPSCAWCGRKITEFTVSRCRYCDLVVCSPFLRDCGFEHYKDRHSSGRRPVRDVETKGRV